jgi:inosose dehydratase
MDEIAAAGYRYTELGPYGYYPTDPMHLCSESKKRGLRIIAGFIFEPLHEPDCAEKVLKAARQTVSLIAAVGGQYLVTIDHVSDSRMVTAGRSAAATRLGGAAYRSMIGLLDEIADLALAKNITPVLHQHVGTYIEFEDELEEILNRVEPTRLGICLDTGHMSYAGMDPIAFYRKHSSRIRYLHFKDVDPVVHRRVVTDGIPFFGAVRERVFCPLGRGVVNWKALSRALAEGKYDGIANIEQDIDPQVSGRPIDDARESLRFLASVGLCT